MQRHEMDSSVPKRKGSSSRKKRKGVPCQQDGDSRAAKVTRHSIPELPEDILGYIHCLMPMREAARAACVSRAFLCSWRGRPNLIFSQDTIGLKPSACPIKFCRKIDTILRNHSGVGVKIFKLVFNHILKVDDISHYLDSWLQVALKPGIEELTLVVHHTEKKYNFPCSLLSDGIQNSIQYLELDRCSLHGTAELGPLRSLTSLSLRFVRISGDELESLLSNCLALEELELMHLGIIWLKISCALEQLTNLRIYECLSLKMIESNAPNLSRFLIRSGRAELSLGKVLKMKKLDMDSPNAVHYARAKLPSIAPNLEILVIGSALADLFSYYEVINIPMLPTKFFFLKHLTVGIRRSYDFLSLVSFLDASPSLDTLILNVILVKNPTLRDDASRSRDMPEQRHGCLKCVNISKFSAEKSLVELTRYILKYAVSLKCLTLDTIHGNNRCHLETSDRCTPILDWHLTEAHGALWAIKTYIEDKVPASVKLTILKPCSQCHGGGHCKMCNV